MKQAAPTADPAGRRWGTLTETAQNYRRSTRSMRRLIASGQITGYRLPGSRLVLIDQDEVEAALQPIRTA